MPGLYRPIGGYSQGNAGSTGQSLQAPIKGLQRALGTNAPSDVPLAPAGEDGDTAPDRSVLGQRTGGEPMAALMDAMRRLGRVY